MDIDQARQLLRDIEVLLYQGSHWDLFWRHLSNEIRVADVDGPFHEACAKLDALGALDADLDQFLNDFIRDQIKRFYEQLYTARNWHLIHGYVYRYSDVLAFVKESQVLLDLLKAKIERIHEAAYETSNELEDYILNQSKTSRVTGVLLIEGELSVSLSVSS
ncbi:MAG: hypothetical protein KME13_17865 [Myxacorys californica WJT36-NPBG1]|jgi:hypothetical protein|nr:hypothetical protein [Myxacorys californica WJT36-NPBG1]